jgi:hypothetical protein
MNALTLGSIFTLALLHASLLTPSISAQMRSAPSSTVTLEPRVIAELLGYEITNMNNRGWIVGTDPDARNPFVWTPRDGLTAIPTALGVGGIAVDVNTAGIVVGYSYSESEITEGWMWTRKEGLTSLGRFLPTVINGRGEMAGRCLPEGDLGNLSACVSVNGVVIDFGFVGEAAEIDNAGVVSGYGTLDFVNYSWFRWRRSSGLQWLPSANGDSSEFPPSFIPVDVNARGDWAGAMLGDFYYDAFIVTRRGVVIPLSERALPVAINDRGDVLGYRLGPTGREVAIWRIKGSLSSRLR